MAQLKLKLKERWINVSTNEVLQSIVSEETIHIDDDLDFSALSQYYTNLRVGSSTHNGVRHEVTLDDGGLSKEEMFDFILNNSVTLHPDGSTWSKQNEDGSVEKIKIDYSVSINGCGMSGYNLVDAINYYVKELS